MADDPEAESVLTQLRDAWLAQPSPLRERTHIANLPTADADENAIIVNALQRRSTSWSRRASPRDSGSR